MFNQPFKLSALMLSGALLAGCGTAVNNPVTGQAERSVMSESAEIAEGRKSHAQVLQEYGVLQNPRVQAYVNGIGQRLAQQSQRANLQWTFTVLDSPEINAFALPGGYVYITRGIMVYLDSEADLAGVVGHEIGHVTARHGAQRATRQQDAGLGVLAAAVLAWRWKALACAARLTWPCRPARVPLRVTWPATAANRNCRPTNWAPSTCRATDTTPRTWWT